MAQLKSEFDRAISELGSGGALVSDLGLDWIVNGRRGDLEIGSLNLNVNSLDLVAYANRRVINYISPNEVHESDFGRIAEEMADALGTDALSVNIAALIDFAEDEEEQDYEANELDDTDYLTDDVDEERDMRKYGDDYEKWKEITSQGGRVPAAMEKRAARREEIRYRVLRLQEAVLADLVSSKEDIVDGTSIAPSTPSNGAPYHSISQDLDTLISYYPIIPVDDIVDRIMFLIESRLGARERNDSIIREVLEEVKYEIRPTPFNAEQYRLTPSGNALEGYINRFPVAPVSLSNTRYWRAIHFAEAAVDHVAMNSHPRTFSYLP